MVFMSILSAFVLSSFCTIPDCTPGSHVTDILLHRSLASCIGKQMLISEFNCLHLMSIHTFYFFPCILYTIEFFSLNYYLHYVCSKHIGCNILPFREIEYLWFTKMDGAENCKMHLGRHLVSCSHGHPRLTSPLKKTNLLIRTTAMCVHNIEIKVS
ncbi:hypothetical protein VPH35_070932 [Triticum aestivum]